MTNLSWAETKSMHVNFRWIGGRSHQSTFTWKSRYLWLFDCNIHSCYRIELLHNLRHCHVYDRYLQDSNISNHSQDYWHEAINWLQKSLENIKFCKYYCVTRNSDLSQEWFYLFTKNVSILISVYMLSHVRLFVTPWTVAHQGPLSIGFFQARILEWVAISYSRGSSWPREPWIPASPALQVDSLLLSYQGSSECARHWDINAY